MDPKTPPKQPNPADNSLPSKGTADTQSADGPTVTNQPRPDSAPTAAPPPTPDAEAPTPVAKNDAAADILTDPTAAGAQSDMGGDTDPGASNTSNIEPL
ncbi:hypothetical protein ACW9KT_07770 [Hymenobacter sp. HD11105]